MGTWDINQCESLALIMNGIATKANNTNFSEFLTQRAYKKRRMQISWRAKKKFEFSFRNVLLTTSVMQNMNIKKENINKSDIHEHTKRWLWRWHRNKPEFSSKANAFFSLKLKIVLFVHTNVIWVRQWTCFEKNFHNYIIKKCISKRRSGINHIPQIPQNESFGMWTDRVHCIFVYEFY